MKETIKLTNLPDSIFVIPHDPPLTSSYKTGLPKKDITIVESKREYNDIWYHYEYLQLEDLSESEIRNIGKQYYNHIDVYITVQQLPKYKKDDTVIYKETCGVWNNVIKLRYGTIKGFYSNTFIKNSGTGAFVDKIVGKLDNTLHNRF